MNIILHDYSNHLTFAPLTLTRPVGNLRTGMWTNNERWEFYCPKATVSYQTEDYLAPCFPTHKEDDNFWMNAAVIPSTKVVDEISFLKEGETLYINEHFVAHRGKVFEESNKKKITCNCDDFILLENRWDLYQLNDKILKTDFNAYKATKKSASLSDTNTVIGDKSQLFIEQGATVECAILNVKSGPIYIGKNAEIMEGTVVRGGLAMAANSVLKLATKVYGATSLGPFCKVGGEVNNVIFQGYSNKGHDGFIGNSVIGEWCNLGADTNCSNLKNNYGTVKTYNYATQKLEQTEEQFMGIAMGDFSKTGINTMLNTATVIGVCSTIFSSGFPPKYIPNFSWGGDEKSPKYDLEKALEAGNKMMERRGLELSDEQKMLLRYLFSSRN